VRAVLDTNVLVSATFRKGNPYHILAHAEHGRIQSVTSPSIAQESRDVLTRDKIPFDDDRVDPFIEKVLAVSEVIAPDINLQVVEDDPDDDKILECAVAGDVDYIVSGDSHLQDLEAYRGITILSPAAFLDAINENRE